MFTRRTLVATSLFVLAAFGAAAPAVFKCQRGPAFGDWELPNGQHDGFLDGKLVDEQTNQGVYAITGILTDVPSPCLSCIQGTIKGELDDGFGPAPDFIVKGEYFGNFFSGQGTFWAYIYYPWGSAPVGKISGEFKDPSYSSGSIGTFKGTWEICY